METKDLISLAELAKEMNENKSRLNYYAWKGLLVPIKRLGHTMIFNKKETERDIEIIKKGKENGKELSAILIELKEKRKR